MLRDQRGWLLVDSVIGMLFLTIAIFAIGLAFMQITKLTTKYSNYNQAVFLAEGALEKLKIQDNEASIEIPLPYKIISSNKVSYDINVHKKTINGLDSNIVPLEVFVTWSESNTTSTTISIVNYYYTKKKEVKD
jgi:hypothetical protein